MRKLKRRYIIQCEFDEDDYDLVEEYGFDFWKNAAMRLEEQVRDTAKSIRLWEYENLRFAEEYDENKAQKVIDEYIDAAEKIAAKQRQLFGKRKGEKTHDNNIRACNR